MIRETDFIRFSLTEDEYRGGGVIELRPHAITGIVCEGQNVILLVGAQAYEVTESIEQVFQLLEDNEAKKQQEWGGYQ